MIKIIFGAPGTGKTTELIKVFDEKIQNTQPTDMCLITYTKSAAKEFRNRIEKNYSLTKKDIPHIGTLHSICFHALQKPVLTTNKDMRDFCQNHNIPTKFDETPENDAGFIEIKNNTQGEFLFTAFDWARHTNPETPQENLYNAPSTIYLNDYLKNNIEKYYMLWEKEKEKTGKIDFTDMLIQTMRVGYTPPTSTLFVDEFQDFTPLEYKLYETFAKNNEDIFITGDDDQAIYTWAGATAKLLLNTQYDQKTILQKTHRLPENILSFSTQLIQNITNREQKNIQPRTRGGVMKKIRTTDYKKIILEANKNTFMLFRTNYMLNSFADTLFNNGIPYKLIKGQTSWSPSFLLLCSILKKIKNNEKLLLPEINCLFRFLPVKGLLKHGIKTQLKNLKDETLLSTYDINNFLIKTLSLEEIISYVKLPENHILNIYRSFTQPINNYDDIKTHLGTIHSSKGLEAETVLIFNNISKRIYDSINTNKECLDDEIRVFYVGCTRAKEKLVVVDDFFETYTFKEGGL